MDHKDWVKNQFKRVKNRAWYRDVIIHSSFIETVVKETATNKNINFECAIEILKANNNYNQEDLNKIDKLRKLRNILIHELLKNNELTNEIVIKSIREAKLIIKFIYHNVEFIQNYFSKKFDLDTKDFS